MRIYVGMQLTSPWFDGVAEIIHKDESEGEIEVMITRQGKYKHTEVWGLESTIESLEKGEFSLWSPLSGTTANFTHQIQNHG